MAALGTSNPTLLDLAKRMDPDGSVADIIEILNETNEVLDDMVWKEGNLPTGHRTTVRHGLPTPTWRKINQGVVPTKSRTVQVTFGTGMLEDWSEIDQKLCELNGNTRAFRLSEDKGHIEGISQELADTLFYGNEGTEPEAFTGLSVYFNSLSAANAENIIVGGSADTDNNSIWLVGWGENTVHGIVPKGSKAGIITEDLGLDTVESATGNGDRMRAYRSRYGIDAGLAVKDWRYIVRIPNIELSALTKDAASGADLADLMFQAIEQLPSLSGVRPAFYMSRRLRQTLRRQVANKTKDSTLSIENVGGKRIMFFQEIPIRRCDALAGNEALVS